MSFIKVGFRRVLCYSVIDLFFQFFLELLTVTCSIHLTHYTGFSPDSHRIQKFRLSVPPQALSTRK